MNETKTIQLITMAIACAVPWLFVLWSVLSNRRELSDIETRLKGIQAKVDATRERLNLPK